MQRHLVNPLFAFSFLESFLETLQDYLGDVTETALKDNFDIVYMVRPLPFAPLGPHDPMETQVADQVLIMMYSWWKRCWMKDIR